MGTLTITNMHTGEEVHIDQVGQPTFYSPLFFTPGPLPNTELYALYRAALMRDNENKDDIWVPAMEECK